MFFFAPRFITICYKTQRLLMCFNKLARPTSTSEVFSQSHDSHVVLHKECQLCQTVSSKSMLGTGQFYTFYLQKRFICRSKNTSSTKKCNWICEAPLSQYILLTNSSFLPTFFTYFGKILWGIFPRPRTAFRRGFLRRLRLYLC